MSLLRGLYREVLGASFEKHRGPSTTQIYQLVMMSLILGSRECQKDEIGIVCVRGCLYVVILSTN